MTLYLSFLFKLQSAVLASSFSDSLSKIQAMPSFFQGSIDWGLEASYKTLGFMAVLALGLQLFKR